jgi:hypothetical protein
MLWSQYGRGASTSLMQRLSLVAKPGGSQVSTVNHGLSSGVKPRRHYVFSDGKMIFLGCVPVTLMRL